MLASRSTIKPFAGAKASRRRDVACQSSSSRRSILLAGGAVAPLIIIKNSEAAQRYLEVNMLTTFQRTQQLLEFRARVQGVLGEILDASDASACVRLALHDAATYDYATKTGGFDASILLNSEELSRPENAGLSAVADKLREAKARVDAGDTTGAGPISWADTLYLAGKVATQKKWDTIKITRGADEAKGQLIAKSFRNPWPVELGRLDATEPGPGRAPAQGADVEEIRQFLLKLGARPGQGGIASGGPFTPKAPFWEIPGFLLWTAAADDPEAEEARFAAANPAVYENIRRSIDASKATVTRTDYEVNFAEAYNKACNLGAKFNPYAYLYRVPTIAL